MSVPPCASEAPSSTERDLQAYGRALYRSYCARPLAEHIATASAITGLARWLRRRRPRTVVELGSGIGTLTHCLVDVGARLEPAPEIHTFEDYEPCAEQMKKNIEPIVARSRASVTFHASYNELEDLAEFDFLLVDGGSPEHLRACSRLSRRGTVFIEGDRKSQRGALAEEMTDRRWICHQFLSARFREPLSHAEPGSEEPVFDGGYSIFLFEPNLLERVEFLGHRLYTAYLTRVLRPRRLARF